MKKRNNFFLFLLIFCILFGYGCQKSFPYDLSYREKSFCAQVEGNQFGVDFCCDIYCETGKISKIVYSSPHALQNVVVSVLEDGSFFIEKGGVSFSCSEKDFLLSGLLSPARRLLLEGFSKSSVNSVQKISGGILLIVSLPNENHPISVSFGEDNLPVVISGTDFSYRIRLR